MNRQEVGVGKSEVSVKGYSELQKLLSEQSELISHLRELESDLAGHLTKDHLGVPPSTCHTCLGYAEGIFADKMDLLDVQKEIDSVKLKS